MSCANCFSPIADRRKETRCSSCSKPLHKDCAINDGGTFCDVCYTVREEEPMAHIEFEMPESIRRSYIETYEECPYKFLKQVIEKNEAKPTCYTQVGIDLHQLFDKATNDRSYKQEKMEHDFYMLYWNQYNDSLFETQELKEKMEERSNKSIEVFYKTIEDMPPPFATEQTILYSISDEPDIPKVQFTMDLIIECEDGELELHDWKTGNVMVGKKLSSDLQAPIYIYGVQEHFKRPVKRFVFHYLNEEKTRVFERNPINPDEYICRVLKREYKISLKEKITKVKHIFSRIKNKDFRIPTDTRSMYFTCKMCGVREQGLCRGADEEAWYQK